MKTFWTSLLGAGLALALSTAVHAQASFNHFETIDLTPQYPGNVATVGTSNLTFTPGSGTNKLATLGGTDIVVANLNLTSTFAPGATDTFNVPYKILVNLTDNGSGQTSGPPNTVPLLFEGTLTGDVTWNSDPNNPSVASTFNNVWTGTQAYSVVVGGTQYNLVTSLFAKPEANAGVGTLNVRVSAVPEPGSMALLGTGLLPLLGLIRRRR